MLLKSIEFKDFRCFRGDVKIDLACDATRNIIVVLGDNTHGKSTIIQAFAWCFYGVHNFANPEIYNRAIARELATNEKTMPSVEVVFEHEGEQYTVRRTQEFTKAADGRMNSFNGTRFAMTYVEKSTGQTKRCGEYPSELNKAINNIIPKDLAPFFFFEGEKDNELTTKSLSNAVRNLLSIDALMKMRDHMRGNTRGISSRSVLGYYEEKQVDSDNLKAKEELNKRTTAESKIEELDIRLDEINTEIKNYENKIDEINKILRQAAPTKALQQRRDQLARDLKRENELLNKAYNNFINDFNDNAVNLFTLPLLDRANEKLNQLDLSDKGIIGIEAPAIKELLRRGKCLCGTDLAPGTVAYKNVELYFDILPPKSVSTLVKQMQDNMLQNNYSGSGFVKKSLESYSDIQYSIKTIHDLERQEQEALDELAKVEEFKTEQYEEDLRQFKKRLENLRDEQKRKFAEKQLQVSNRDTAIINYNKYVSQSKRNEEYALYYAYAQRIYEWLSQEYDNKEKQIRTMLEESVTNLFNKIYVGNRKVTIDSNYNISVSPMADTGGIKAIQYFSYVGGLVQVARKIMNERQEGELYGEEYPLVLDAAFSHTDTKHTKAIAVELSKVTSQLVFAVMDKDWAHVGNEIAENIFKTYTLKKVNEDEVGVEEIS